MLTIGLHHIGGDGHDRNPPAGAALAIVEFEDLQCPRCAAVTGVVHDAARVYKIPLVRYDFPLPIHSWSKQAAIIADLEPAAAQKLCADYQARKLFCQVKKPEEFVPPFGVFWR